MSKYYKVVIQVSAKDIKALERQPNALKFLWAMNFKMKKEQARARVSLNDFNKAVADGVVPVPFVEAFKRVSAELKLDPHTTSLVSMILAPFTKGFALGETHKPVKGFSEKTELAIQWLEI